MLHLSYKFAGEWHTLGTDIKDLTGIDSKNITKKQWLELCDNYLQENFGQFKKKTEWSSNSQGILNDGINAKCFNEGSSRQNH